MTYDQFLREAIACFLQIGLSRIESHERARLLLDGATQTRYAHLLHPQAKLRPDQIKRLQKWQEEVVQGRPIPYILGKAAFHGLEFFVDERVLIPRPETELLVEIALKKLKKEESPRLADLGTGSGAIAIALAKSRADAQIWALDISAGALEVAHRNALCHDVAIHFLQGTGEWIKPLTASAPFDAIVSNPPYIAAREIETLEVGVRDFEPRLALDGGDDGLNPYRELAAGAAALLRIDGFLAVELGMGQFGGIKAIFEANAWQVEPPYFDLAGIERVLVAHPSKTNFER